MLWLKTLLSNLKKQAPEEEETESSFPAITQVAMSLRLGNFAQAKEIYEKYKAFVDKDLALNSPLHLTAMYAPNVETFKAAWDYFLNEGYNPLDLNANKYTPFFCLLIKNDHFFRGGTMGDAFAHVFPKVYNATHLPDEYTGHLIYFFKDYAQAIPNWADYIEVAPVTYYKYLPKAEWIKFYPATTGIYNKNKELFQEENIETITFKLTGRRSKSFKKFIHENWHKNKFWHLDVIRNVCKLNLEDYQILEILNHVLSDNVKSTALDYFRNSHETQVNQTIPLVGYKKFFKLFIETPYEISHCVRMIANLALLDVRINFKEFRHGKEMHDWCSRESNRLAQLLRAKEYEALNKGIVAFRPKIEHLHGHEFDNYSLVIPVAGKELLHWGAELRICVGSFFYGKDLAEGKIFLIFIKKNGKEYGCCHVRASSLEIVKIKGPCNKTMDSEVTKEINIQLKKINRLFKI